MHTGCNSNQLTFTAIGHATWVPRPGTNPAEKLFGLAAVRYYRFDRKVRVDKFRLCPTLIRWEPDCYTRPDHVVISRYDEASGWQTVADVRHVFRLLVRARRPE